MWPTGCALSHAAKDADRAFGNPSRTEERKVIDRTKGILMRAGGIGEEDADALRRTTAMDQALVMTAELLK